MHIPSFSTANDAATYALAGNATITLRSTKTDAYFTYRIVAKRDDETGKRDAREATLFFVSLLTGPDNTNDYRYLGIMRRTPVGLTFQTTAKSCANEDAPSVKAFRFFHKHVLAAGNLPEALEIRHMGACGRCHRPLTTPESLERGIGPECAGKLAA